MPPFRSKPGVVKVEPADDRAGVECSGNRVELVRRSRHTRTAREYGPWHNRAQHLRAGRIVQREDSATERVNQTVAGNFSGIGAVSGVVEHIVSNLSEEEIRRGAG